MAQICVVCTQKDLSCAVENPFSSLFWRISFWTEAQTSCNPKYVHFHSCMCGAEPQEVHHARLSRIVALQGLHKECNRHRHKPWGWFSGWNLFHCIGSLLCEKAVQAGCTRSARRVRLTREKLKVPPRPFPLEEQSHYKHSGQLQVFFTQLEPNSHGVRQNSHVSVETNSNKRISVLGTNHTKIYRVNLVGFKHSAEDPSRSPQKQNKYTLRSKRFSNVLSNHQGRFPETVPEAKHSLTEVPITSD